MTEKEQLRRRHFLVDVRSQLYLSLILITYLIVYTILMILIILAPSVLTFLRPSVPIEMQYQASRDFLLLEKRAIPVIILIMMVMSAHFVMVTHRIFGPFHRLKDVLRRWREGEWPGEFKGRPRDFNNDFFNDFNRTTALIGMDLLAAREKLTACLRKMEKEAPESAASELAEAMSLGQEALNKMGRFRIREEQVR